MRDFGILAAQQVDEIVNADADLVLAGKVALRAGAQLQAQPVVQTGRETQSAEREVGETPGLGGGGR